MRQRYRRIYGDFKPRSVEAVQVGDGALLQVAAKWYCAELNSPCNTGVLFPFFPYRTVIRIRALHWHSFLRSFVVM